MIKKEQFLISVIMPVYNAEKYLKESVESILSQSYKRFELIIINDGSTDDSLNIINIYKEIDTRIVVISRENKGLIYSLNEGIERSKGEYIARMDSDDISLPQRFARQINLMQEQKLDICGCHYYIINEHNEYIDTAIVPLNNESFLNHLCITTPFAHPSVMMKKSFMTKSDLLMYGSTQYKNAEDYSFWIEFWNKKAKFGNVNGFLFQYREFSSSLSKINRINISKDKRGISKKFILNNKERLLDNFKSLDFKLISKREQEFAVLIIIFLIKYNFSFKYIYNFKGMNKRAVICGILKFISEKY